MTIFSADRDTEVFFINDHGDMETSSTGLRLDSSPRTKALLALKARRGQYWFDKNYGSRFYTIKTLDAALRQAKPHAVEALQFMIDRGEIQRVELVSVRQDPDSGALWIALALTVSEDSMVDIIVQQELPS